MYFVRKSSPALPEPDLEARVKVLTDDLSNQLKEGGVSVFSADSEPELRMVAALFCVKSDKPRSFGYYKISEEAIVEHGVEVRPEKDDPGCLFAYLRERHYEFKKILNTTAFARTVAQDDKIVIPKQEIIELVRAEREARTVTTADEWAATREWKKKPQA